jgi:hypothetical protein
MQLRPKTALTRGLSPHDFDSPFCSSRMLMRSNDRAINAVLLPINLSISIAHLLQSFQHALPHPGFDPPIKAAGYGAPRTILVGQISPRGCVAKIFKLIKLKDT